jgi:hypothetical protein
MVSFITLKLFKLNPYSLTILGLTGVFSTFGFSFLQAVNKPIKRKIIMFFKRVFLQINY